MEADWANLPPDLLTAISEKASTTNTQYIHLRFVCKPWRRALTRHPRHLPRQAPWLLPLGRIDGDDFELSFYDLDQSKTHRFVLPFVSGKYICGSSHGWLALEHDHRLSLLNPLTGNSIELPSFNQFNAPPVNSGVSLGKRKRSTSPSDQRVMYETCVLKVVFSCNPSEPGCFVVANLRLSECQLGFCRIGDAYWKELQVQVDSHRTPLIVDFTCHNRFVYTINDKKKVTTYDLEKYWGWNSPSNFSYNRIHDRIYMVEGDEEFGGPLVVRHSDIFGKVKVCVFRWFNEPQPEWRQVKDIGRRVLFLNHLNRFGTFSSANLQLEKWRGNQIYFDVRRRRSDDSIHIGIGRVNLEGRTKIENVAGSIAVCRSTSGATLWFTPSLI